LLFAASSQLHFNNAKVDGSDTTGITQKEECMTQIDGSKVEGFELANIDYQ